MNLTSFLWSAAVAGLYVAANVLTKRSLEPGRAWLMILVSVLAVGAFFAFRAICKQFGLAVASGVVDSLLTLLTLAIAVLWDKEVLTTTQLTGLGFILVGLFLVR